MENNITTISREELEELKEAFSKIGEFAELFQIMALLAKRSTTGGTIAF